MTDALIVENKIPDTSIVSLELLRSITSARNWHKAGTEIELLEERDGTDKAVGEIEGVDDKLDSDGDEMVGI
ncbi:hypothetical protein SERLA73DRAFT_75842 [Serpula lacrymans var. lacrymans S7.3]|uniref:Uncharacterized protein n=1 Tax=Serpula lacrymans var. lacrymans (strain S7.3) TaxID=936435 RepID=F8Q4E4_SERL3|nr:hypothetical protein SERLA73DRAFT_75842 [Serpula lacrymans var. lacrymans S7.3]